MSPFRGHLTRRDGTLHIIGGQERKGSPEKQGLGVILVQAMGVGETGVKPMIAIVGRPNVGKSTLFNRIAGGKKAIVWDEPGVTRDRNYADVTWEESVFTLIDTGGFEPVSKDRLFIQMREQCQVAMDQADAILFMMDGREGLSS